MLNPLLYFYEFVFVCLRAPKKSNALLLPEDFLTTALGAQGYYYSDYADVDEDADIGVLNMPYQVRESFRLSHHRKRDACSAFCAFAPPCGISPAADRMLMLAATALSPLPHRQRKRLRTEAPARIPSLSLAPEGRRGNSPARPLLVRCPRSACALCV